MFKKKLFVILAIAVIASVAGYFAYNAWFKKKSVAKAASIGGNFQLVSADKEAEEAAIADLTKSVLPGNETETENSANK